MLEPHKFSSDMGLKYPSDVSIHQRYVTSFSSTLCYSNEINMFHNTMRPHACPLRIREMNQMDKGPKVTRSLTSFKLMGNEDLGVQ